MAGLPRYEVRPNVAGTFELGSGYILLGALKAKPPTAFQPPGFTFFGAGNGIRTRDFDLGKVALYR